MNKTVILRLNRRIDNGEYHVIAEVGNEGFASDVEIQGSLPPVPVSLINKVQVWRDAILNLEANKRLKVKKLNATPYKSYSRYNEGKHVGYKGNMTLCESFIDEISHGVNSWLSSSSFSCVIHRLWKELSLEDHIQIIVRTDDLNLCYIPWSCWNLLKMYKKSEVSFSLSNESYSHNARRNARRLEGLKILAVLGDDEGIDSDRDVDILKEKFSENPNVFIRDIYQPSVKELEEDLKRGCWDLLFFSGHSETYNGQGIFYLGGGQSVRLSELQHGLREAVSGGLKLAVFNSCDGIGLAKDFQELQIPQTIVMREPISDNVAQEFLLAYVESILELKSHTPLYIAERQAREKIRNQYPHADWLPVIFQNHKVPSPVKGNIGKSRSTISTRRFHSDISEFLPEIEMELLCKPCKIVNPVGKSSAGKINYNGRLWKARMYSVADANRSKITETLFPGEEAVVVARQGNMYLILPQSLCQATKTKRRNKRGLKSLVFRKSSNTRIASEYSPHLIVLPIICLFGVLIILGIGSSFNWLISTISVSQEDSADIRELNIPEPSSFDK